MNGMANNVTGMTDSRFLGNENEYRLAQVETAPNGIASEPVRKHHPK